MCKKRLTKDGACPKCAEKEESINHMLFQCPFSRLVWALSHLGYLFHPLPNNSLFENLSVLLLPSRVENGDGREKERFKAWPWILWFIWKNRNDQMFSGEKKSSDDVIKQATEAATEWHQANTTLVSPQPHGSSLPLQKKWFPPEPNSYKCNVDGSWKIGSGRSGIAWILRDSTGAVKQIGAKCLSGLLSPLETEVAALVWAISCINVQGIHNVVFESDCKNVIQAVINPSQWPRLLSFTSEIQGYNDISLNYEFSFINREGNRCADVMAKHITLCPIYFALLDVSLPLWLLHFVELNQSCNQSSSISN